MTARRRRPVPACGYYHHHPSSSPPSVLSQWRPLSPPALTGGAPSWRRTGGSPLRGPPEKDARPFRHGEDVIAALGGGCQLCRWSSEWSRPSAGSLFRSVFPRVFRGVFSRRFQSATSPRLPPRRLSPVFTGVDSGSRQRVSVYRLSHRAATASEGGDEGASVAAGGAALSAGCQVEPS